MSWFECKYNIVILASLDERQKTKLAVLNVEDNSDYVEIQYISYRDTSNFTEFWGIYWNYSLKKNRNMHS